MPGMMTRSPTSWSDTRAPPSAWDSGSLVGRVFRRAALSTDTIRPSRTCTSAGWTAEGRTTRVERSVYCADADAEGTDRPAADRGVEPARAGCPRVPQLVRGVRGALRHTTRLSGFRPRRRRRAGPEDRHPGHGLAAEGIERTAGARRLRVLSPAVPGPVGAARLPDAGGGRR